MMDPEVEEAINQLESDLAVPDVDPMTIPLEDAPFTMRTLQALMETPTVPKRYRNSETGVQDMFAAILHGQEMGIGKMEAIDKLILIDGSKSMYGTLMCAQVYRNHHAIKVKIKTKPKMAVTVVAYRRDPWTHLLEEQGEWTFDDDDAKKAYLDSKGTYEEYPKLMYFWRAMSAVGRIWFADCLAGFSYTPWEVGVDVPMEPVPDYVELDVDGESIEIENATAEVEAVFPEAEVVIDRKAPDDEMG